MFITSHFFSWRIYCGINGNASSVCVVQNKCHQHTLPLHSSFGMFSCKSLFGAERAYRHDNSSATQYFWMKNKHTTTAILSIFLTIICELELDAGTTTSTSAILKMESSKWEWMSGCLELTFSLKSCNAPTHSSCRTVKC